MSGMQPRKNNNQKKEISYLRSGKSMWAKARDHFKKYQKNTRQIGTTYKRIIIG